ncbi:YdcF family protein [Cognatishimia sp. F0-27]|uniref:YdcF family protein n=1 Tax=Cognatishimia sp. F0-27 TaxID=2816855 RepID=UPI001D0CBB85|nr:YdcF family protein [Cognatishimia sp. F0-27]MCC1493940.1 YdcF family protein [Cognatishimia sp. F0-27]
MTPRPLAIVLGAAVWPGGVPSPTLRRRTAHALNLWREGAISGIVATGGLGRHGPSEASVIAETLMAEGVPRTHIMLEEQSTRTLENLAFARPFLLGAETREVVIVSDIWHLPRALLIARQLGMRARGAAVPIRGSRPWPFAKAAAREVPGLVWTVMTGWRRRW